MVCDQEDQSGAVARMRNASWRHGDRSPTVVVKSWRRSTPSVDDCGFVAVSRCYAAWEISSRDKACLSSAAVAMQRVSKNWKRSLKWTPGETWSVRWAIPRPRDSKRKDYVSSLDCGWQACAQVILHMAFTTTRTHTFITVCTLNTEHMVLHVHRPTLNQIKNSLVIFSFSFKFL